jgi:hypothetical protein
MKTAISAKGQQIHGMKQQIGQYVRDVLKFTKSQNCQKNPQYDQQTPVRLLHDSLVGIDLSINCNILLK